ncbi:uncharacterized protein LOC129614477 [Condylostylus longicornis]|uniref:uncharacterized protein LOC129614477 n=1 Tax=Condylostylus longicornis TaxID=2530218 RepID=UPI00244DAC33|nr:uncharacterized protein LOC129614477 [Condylostylus longicornis]
MVLITRHVKINIQIEFVLISIQLNFTFKNLRSFVLAIWLIYFPESPKFLAEHDERELSLEILMKVFRINTGRSEKEYKVTGVKKISFASVHKIHSHLYVTVKKLRLYKSKELKLLLKAAARYTGKLFSEKYLLRTIFLFGIQFGLTCSYYTLMLWFPELFNRYKIFHMIKGYSNVSICEISKELIKRSDEVEKIQSETAIDNDVYTETLYLGLACLPLSLLFPFIVHRVGSRLLLGIGLAFDSLAVFLILFAKTELQNLILSCVFKLLASISISLLYAITVDLYSAKIRVIAAALGMSIGRCAALLGNVIFGYFIDTVCYLPFITFGILLLISSILTFLLPTPDPKLHFGEEEPRIHRKRSLLSHL